MKNNKILVEDEKGRHYLSIPEFLEKFNMKVYMQDWDSKQGLCPFVVKKVNDTVRYELFSLQSYEVGEIVLLYRGKRGTYKPDDFIRDYTITAFDEKGQVIELDPEKEGGLARFMAHAFHQPLRDGAAPANCIPVPGPQPGEVSMIAARKIEKGHALRFNYGLEWWEERANKFPLGPAPLTIHGQLMAPVVHSAQEKELFLWQENLAEARVAEAIGSQGTCRFDLDPFDILKDFFPQCQWKSLNFKQGVVIAITGYHFPDVVALLGVFKTFFSKRIKLEICEVDEALYAVSIEGLDRKEYMRLLQLKIDQLISKVVQKPKEDKRSGAAADPSAGVADKSFESKIASSERAPMQTVVKSLLTSSGSIFTPSMNPLTNPENAVFRVLGRTR